MNFCRGKNVKKKLVWRRLIILCWNLIPSLAARLSVSTAGDAVWYLVSCRYHQRETTTGATEISFKMQIMVVVEAHNWRPGLAENVGRDIDQNPGISICPSRPQNWCFGCRVARKRAAVARCQKTLVSHFSETATCDSRTVNPRLRGILKRGPLIGTFSVCETNDDRLFGSSARATIIYSYRASFLSCLKVEKWVVNGFLDTGKMINSCFTCSCQEKNPRGMISHFFSDIWTQTFIFFTWQPFLLKLASATPVATPRENLKREDKTWSWKKIAKTRHVK